MGFLQAVAIMGAPFLTIVATMHIAYLDEKFGTGKDLTTSKVVFAVIIALSLVLIYVYIFKTPLGAPIFELLSDGEGAGSLIIFTGSIGIPLPLALIAILMLFMFNAIVAIGSAVSLVMVADIVVGLVSKLMGVKK